MNQEFMDSLTVVETLNSLKRQVNDLIGDVFIMRDQQITTRDAIIENINRLEKYTRDLEIRLRVLEVTIIGKNE
jgi:hypothetical protein